MYYRYDEKDEIIEKSATELEGDNIVTSEENIDIQLFRVVVGFISDTGEMLRHTKFIRSEEDLSRRLSDMQENQILSELDIDLRLSMIELGLI